VFKPGDWGPGRRMPGWNYWSPTRKGTYSYVPGATEFMNNDGTSSWPDKYVADTVRDRTIHQIDKWAATDKPFFIWASHVGPHGSIGMHVDHAPIPAAEYADWSPPGEPQNFTLPDSITSEPSFNEADVSDKVRPMQLPLQDPDALNQRFRARVRSLQSIDDANAAIVNELAALGELDNTVIIFVSDNGFSLGQHRYFGKSVPWNEALQVPFLIRGPGITPGTVSTQTASMVDIAPTILAYAGALRAVRKSGRTDGENLKAVLTKPGTNLSPTSLIQVGTATPEALKRFGWTWRGVRTDRYTYARWWDGEEEFYDRQDDPYELTNLIDNTIPAPRFHKKLRAMSDPARQQELRLVLADLRWRYEQLKDCGRGKNQRLCERL
jgi:N-acetylglucosamine-6-sulfatase